MLLLNIIPRRISVVELFTGTSQVFNTAGAPRYMDIPIAANSTGTTILFYGRSNGAAMANAYREIVMANTVGGGSALFAQNVQRFEAFADGSLSTSAPKDKFAADKWVRFLLRTPTATPNRTAGVIRLSGPSFGPANFSFADVRVYSRALTNAEAGNPFPPTDADAIYTFAGQTGTSVIDQTGNGRTATLVY